MKHDTGQEPRDQSGNIIYKFFCYYGQKEIIWEKTQCERLKKNFARLPGDIPVSMVQIIKNFMIFEGFFKTFKEDPKPF